MCSLCYIVVFALICSTTTVVVSGAPLDSWDELPDVLKVIPPPSNRAHDSISSDATAFDVILAENRILKDVVPNGLFLEGDIYLGSADQQRNAILNKDRRWPGGIIPYEIDSSFDMTRRNVIMDAIAEFHKHTCLRFVPRSTQTDYLHVYPGRGCWTYVGKSGGKQPVSLGNGCVHHKRTPMHEFMHTAGFYHEQSRTDRDNYISILWQNIIDGMANQFEKYGRERIQHLGASYDYYSIMHYSSTAFSKDGVKKTILPRQAGATASDLGSSLQFTPTDIYKLNALYECDGGGETGTGGDGDGDGDGGDNGNKWRDDLRCGPSYPLSNGSPAECDPNGIYPCCAPSGWCGNTVNHCKCSACTDYGTGGGDDDGDDDDNGGGGTGSSKTWRDDLRCGPSYPLSNGSPAECDPNGIYPCCAPSGWCGNTINHCKCSACTDYGTGGDDDDNGGGGTGSSKTWRDDLRCGPSYPLSNGSPAKCDPNGIYPCCAPSGWCGNTIHHCACSACTNYEGNK